MKYISKPGEWFDEGTEVKLIDDYRTGNPGDKHYWNAGLFEGIHEGKLDQEICPFDEFEVIEE